MEKERRDLREMKTITKRKANKRPPEFANLERKPCAYDLVQYYRSGQGLEKRSCEQRENWSSYYLTLDSRTMTDRCTIYKRD